MWKYNNSGWVWMAGSQLINKAPTYSGDSAGPGSRTGSVFWSDDTGFWLFGGKQNTGTNFWSDLWCYDVSTKMWNFYGGNQQANLGNGKYKYFISRYINMILAAKFPGGREGAVGGALSPSKYWIGLGRIGSVEGNSIEK